MEKLTAISKRVMMICLPVAFPLLVFVDILPDGAVKTVFVNAFMLSFALGIAGMLIWLISMLEEMMRKHFKAFEEWVKKKLAKKTS